MIAGAFNPHPKKGHPMFNIHQAILDIHMQTASTDELRIDWLREQHPNLSRVWDKVEELQEEAIRADETTQEELRDMSDEIGRYRAHILDCAQRFAQIDAMVQTLARFDQIKDDPILALLEQLSGKCDDARDYINAQL